MTEQQQNSFGWKQTEMVFTPPEKVESLLFWEFDHREIAKLEKVSFKNYATNKTQHIANFFGRLSSLRYMSSLKLPTETFLNGFLNSLPFPSEISLTTESEIDEDEYKLALLLMTLFPLEQSVQTLVLFTSSHANGSDVLLVTTELELGVFLVLGLFGVSGTSLLWESKTQWEPAFFYCPEMTPSPSLFS
ncbi:MAG: hypothetical protein ACFFGZ_10525 [Candidatus Thorarchaeota archaeon]